MARKSRKPGRTPGQAPEAARGERVWNAALYVRLSVEDNGRDSDSIENQTRLLEAYAAERPGLRRAALFVDNGYTGTDFQRPGYVRMMESVKRGEIDCIVVKDLSRLGRDYIATSQFIERLCPLLGLRFIAVNDGLDTLTMTGEGRLSASLSNIINDYYARDISRKVTTALHARMERGEFVANYAPYGYERDPEDRSHLAVCAETAPVVRQIFAWRAEGGSYMGICRRLNAAGVPSPGEARLARGIGTRGKKPETILWNRHVLTEMLANPVYIGRLVQRKQSRCLYAGIPAHVTEEAERFVTQDAHPPIVDEALFARVQALNGAQRQRAKAGAGRYAHLPAANNIYGRRLVCARCGRAMKLHRSFSKDRDRAYFMFKCPTYAEHGAAGCRDVKIRKAELDAAVLESIRAQLAAFARLRTQAEERSAPPVPARRAAETRLRDVRAQLSALYAALKEGDVSKEAYERQRETLSGELRALEAQMKTPERAALEAEPAMPDGPGWEAVLARFADEGEVSAGMVEALVERMELQEDGTLSIRFRFRDALEALRGADGGGAA